MEKLLPEELIVEIFSRLPAKSAGRCRCLSKSWRTLLSHPQFCKTHLNQTIDHPKISLLLIAESQKFICSASFDNAHQVFDEITVPATKLSFRGYPGSWLHAYASCHGLVLAGDIYHKTFVLNPVTREMRRIPDSPLFLNPKESFIMHGFGYDSVNNDYLLVTMSRYDTENGFGSTTDNEDDSDYCPDMLVNVHSMKRNTWEKVDVSPYYCRRVASGVFLHGCIHWVGEVSSSAEVVVVVFNLAEKKFTEMKPLSSFVHQRVYDSSLAVLDGCLCVYRDKGSVVWVMEEYGVQESWTSFMINDLGVRVPFDDTKILCMLGKEEIVLSTNCGTKTVVYSLKHGNFKDVVFRGTQHDLFAHTSFVESLISPYPYQ